MPRWLISAVLLTTLGMVLEVVLQGIDLGLSPEGHFLEDRILGPEGGLLLMAGLLLSPFACKRGALAIDIVTVTIIVGMVIHLALAGELLDGWDTRSLLPLSAVLEGYAALYFLRYRIQRVASEDPREQAS